mmetsp:Transcript_26271/g.57779  ORF Transcript_26271/g.57779 Transcript_26271/m.57779 type:complete len:99 (-) Transcript_26271:188-484(-)
MIAAEGQGQEVAPPEPNGCTKCLYGCLDCLASCMMTIMTCCSAVSRFVKGTCIYPVKETAIETYDELMCRLYPYQRGVKVPYMKVPNFKFGEAGQFQV